MPGLLSDRTGRFTKAGLKKHATSLLEMYAAGGVTQEIVDGIPITENIGLKADRGMAQDVLKRIGYTEEQANLRLSLIEQNVRKELQQTELTDIIKEYGAVREEGLDDWHLVSPERTNEMLERIRQLRVENAKRATEKPDDVIGGVEESGAVGRPIDAGREEGISGRPRPKVGIEVAPEDIGETISTRFPKAVRSTENPLSHNLRVDVSEIAKTPGLAEKFTSLIKDYPGFKLSKKMMKNPEASMTAFVHHLKDNLKHLYEQTAPAEREANRQWYDGANKFTKEIADEFDLDHRQMAGVTASLSPQKDWDMNVSLAKRVADIYTKQQDTKTSPEMIVKGKEIVAKTKGNNTLRGIIDTLKNKTFSELTDPLDRAAWLRLYDETYNPRDFDIIGPDGSSKGLRKTKTGNNSKVAWGSLNEIAKAISIMSDGSKENISNQLGQQHKVRSFYNNIIDPNSTRGDVTIDTHAVAAALLRPLSGNSKEVLDNFAGPGSNVTGISGTYALYQEAYRLAAKELDIAHPRELQSIVWEKIRKVYPSTFKQQAANVQAVDAIWRKYSEGKITIQQARKQALEFTRPSAGADEAGRGASDTPKLPANRVPGKPASTGR